MSDLERSWKDLLTWLEDKHGWKGADLKVEWKDVPGAGRGLFATEDISPRTTLLTLPPSSLLHPRNIFSQHPSGLPHQVFPKEVVPKQSSAPIFAPAPVRSSSSRSSHSVNRSDGKRQKASSSPLLGRPGSQRSLSGTSSILAPNRLTTTQVLSLYLALYRPRPEQTSSPSPWLPYLRTLPDTFRDWHPLTWTISPSSGRTLLSCGQNSNGIIPDAPLDADTEWRLLNMLAKDQLPASAKLKLDDVARRYARDKSKITAVMEEISHHSSQSNGDPETSDDWRSAWDRVTEEDFLWAWLNVNTRTFYLPLNIPSSEPKRQASCPPKKEDLDAEQQNHTMAPVLDFANHCHTNYTKACTATNIAFVRNTLLPGLKPKKTKGLKEKAERKRSKNDANLSDAYSSFSTSDSAMSGGLHQGSSVTIKADAKSVIDAPWAARSLHLVSPKPVEQEDSTENDPDDTSERLWLKKGEEVFFPYGGHDDDVLFTEYGFVPFYLSPAAETSIGKGVEAGGNPHSAIVVDKEMDVLWSKCDSKSREAKHELLDMQGYLGDYTLHTHPTPQPSHRLLPALRLLHTPALTKDMNGYIQQPYFPIESYSLVLASWMDTLTGKAEKMTDEIEGKVKDSLVHLCDLVIQEANEGILNVETQRQRLHDRTDASEEGIAAVKRLWEDQKRGGEMVKQGILDGTAY